MRSDAPGPDAADFDEEVDAADARPMRMSDDVIASEEIRQFEADLSSLQRERDEWLDTTRRLQADFENYRKRVVREQTALVERASEGLVEQMLPVLDNFELALRSITAEHEQVRKGVELVYAELLSRVGAQRPRAHRRAGNAVRSERARSGDAGRRRRRTGRR